MESATLQIIREFLVYQINESRVRQVELATLPADMALLAAQQVNEIRFRALEEPKDIGWDDIAFEFVLLFVSNSAFFEKIIAKIFQRLYGRILSSQLALEHLPKSTTGIDLINDLAYQPLAKSVKDKLTMVVPKSVVDQIRHGYIPDIVLEFEKAEKVLAAEIGKYAKLSEIKKDELKIYAQSINEFIMESKNPTALAKAANDFRRRGLPRTAPKLMTTDGSSVAVMEHFISAARAQRIHIESLHNRYEYISRTFPLSSGTFISLKKMFDINMIFDSEKEVISMDMMASSIRLRMEAMIWALHLGFLRINKTPVYISNPGQPRVFPDIHTKIENYLFERFGTLVENYGEKPPSNPWSKLDPHIKGYYLREYFWSITDQFK